MAFQRSYSRVWWDSDNQLPVAGSSFTSGGFYAQFNQQQRQQQQQQQQHGQTQAKTSRILGTLGDNNNNSNGECNSNSNSNSNIGVHEEEKFGFDNATLLTAAAGIAVTAGDMPSSDAHSYKSFNANLSCIQEVEDEQDSTKLSWKKRDSPGSLRSQDSGFSDNDDVHSRRMNATVSPCSATKSVTSAGTPQSTRSVATPPTVLRRIGNSSFYSPLLSVPTCISFAASKDRKQQETAAAEQVDFECSRTQLFAQLDDLHLATAEEEEQQQGQKQEHSNAASAKKTRKQLKFDEVQQELGSISQGKPMPTPMPTPTSTRKPTPKSNANSLKRHKRVAAQSCTFYAYNEDDGNDGDDDDDDNDDDVIAAPMERPLVANTSTPNAKARASTPHFLEQVYELHNEQEPAEPLQPVAAWLNALRTDCATEYMFTLQAKSIAKEAYKRATITPNHVTKLIRQLQQRAFELQLDFERNERALSETQLFNAAAAEAQAQAQLIEASSEYVKLLERRMIFCVETRAERQRFAQQIEQLKLTIKDTQYSLERQHYINAQSLLDDLHVLKRQLLIATRMIFERMLHVLVQRIEHAQCDLLLRANINMLATLASAAPNAGFAALDDAFVQCGAVRALLMILLDHDVSTLRAQALRALAAICGAPAAIAQFCQHGGLEMLRDVLHVEHVATHERIERREAVSLLTQITASWHGPEHRVPGLIDCIEPLIAGIAELIVPDCCTQTLLLCAAALNNLSRLEATSHYSIMSNELILRLIVALEPFDATLPVFLYEQTSAMLYNMSLNKKCHGHLAQGVIINFIMSIYETELHRRYNRRAESEAQRRAIKSLLHALMCLMQGGATVTAHASGSGSGSGSGLSAELEQARELLRLDGIIGSSACATEQLLLSTAAVSDGHQRPEAQTGSKTAAAAENDAANVKFSIVEQEETYI